jgi:hypothetical protein
MSLQRVLQNAARVAGTRHMATAAAADLTVELEGLPSLSPGAGAAPTVSSSTLGNGMQVCIEKV